MPIEYTQFDPDAAVEQPDGGPTKDDLLLQIESDHHAAVNADPVDSQLVERLEARHAAVARTRTTHTARQAYNDAVLAEQIADRDAAQQ